MYDKYFFQNSAENFRQNRVQQGKSFKKFYATFSPQRCDFLRFLGKKLF